MLKPTLLAVMLLGLSVSNFAGETAQKPQSLMEIYRLAVQQDPSLASALSANQAAQELIEQGKALYRPTVNFSASATATQSDIAFVGGANPFRNQGKNNFEGYNYAFEARQPIYRKQNLIGIDQSKTQVCRADKQLHLAQQQVMLRATEAYFQVLDAQDRIALIQSQKAAIMAQLNQAKANFEVGTATITDKNEAQARFDLILAQEISAVNEFEIAKRNIQLLTGAVPDALAKVKPEINVAALKQEMAEWLNVAKQNNLNIQIQEDAVKLAEQEYQRAEAAHLPTLDAVANYNSSYTNGGVNGFGTDVQNASIGLQVQVPIYQGGSLSSRARQAALDKQRAQADVQVARRQVELETQRAFLNLSTSIAQVKALDLALNSSQTQLDSTKLGYEVGVRTSVDVLNAQQQLFSAKRDLLQARYNYLVNIIRLKFAAGMISESDIDDINQQLTMVEMSKP